MENFNFQTFTNLAKQSLKKAEAYRVQCGGKKQIIEEKMNGDTTDTELEVLKKVYIEKTWKKLPVNIKLETLKTKLEALN